ncbi:aminodeoxychorismate lyase [Bifidobacterium psychraerophilum]|jgi:4-amino-4-deoxychorismate lyase|uniref:aminodeoxychorismate lyase n=1 Tax=Bifidobacterium psychraerophilum TaxID=218140 RepID=UPI0023F2ABFB|nr:aminodeoxychorismate lyase [Bifidobacterium psychraerophilum]MCI1660667.1 aminodeoxychorismate lyase [Bifidobacterium psychraerophilum]MCI1804570.1 aminodeoxychorismate lyase [Bifidobacterium psychraerophilum]MCI2177103.1 aminodeoxychorismate lyase [Bifidobacterium psychraerophilum]MCI2181643.1 aminodeoxychorismate lyase [Bifidobacterium psychraerophilum]
MGNIILGVGNAARLFHSDTGEGKGTEDLINIVDPRAHVVSAFDFAVTRGDGIFEATTVWKGQPVSLENHLRRLSHSARLMDLPQPDIEAFAQAVHTLIEQYDGSEAGPLLRLLISRGLDDATGIGRQDGGLPSIWMFIDAMGSLHETDPISMISLTRGYPSDIAVRAPWLLNGAKTLSYAVNQAIHRECDRRKVTDAVLTTEDGYVLECPNSSIVAQYGTHLVTPDPSIGILHGTTQRELFAYGRQEGGSFEYAKLPFERLLEADRLYMTHGGWVVPVGELDGRRYPVDPSSIEYINAAIHAGRTHDEALGIGPKAE